MADISKNILNNHNLVRTILLLALSLATLNAVFAAQISGFVWLDNDLNGIQDTSEPGFAQTVPGFGAPNIALYATGSIELIEFIPLDKASNGQYSFNNVADGDYYVCVSNEFLELGLTVTTPNAGDDAIDSDFDFSPCSYGISVSGEQVVERDLGLVDNTTEVTEAGSIDVSVAVDHDGDGVVHFRFPEVPDIILELYSNEDGRLIKSALSQSAFGFTPDPDFHNIPVGSYFICASSNVIEDGEPVIRPVEATIPNIGSSVGDSELSDSDFITQADGSVCTNSISVQIDMIIRIGLGLSPTVIKPIVVNEFCTLDDALKSAVRGIPIGFCPSGGSQSIHDGTVFLQENSRHGTIVAPGFPGAGNPSTATITGLGQGAFADVVEANGRSNSDSFADLTIENLSVKVAKALGANLTITNSTIEDDLVVGEFCCSRVKIENSTICGVYVESLSIVYNSGNPTQSTLSLNPCIETNSGTSNQISGFVWMDNNGDGLQNNGEPGFAQTVPGFGAPNIALYTTGSTEFIEFIPLDEASNGLYSFENVPDGEYYVCVSNQFLLLGLSVTTADAGDDRIDSDFDFSPCSYGIVVSDGQLVKRDLGLVGDGTAISDGTIRGHVWQDRYGDGLRQLENADNGINGVELQLSKLNDPTPIATTVSSGFPSSNRGTYRFENLPPGNYVVCAVDSYSSLKVRVTIKDAGTDDTIDSDFDSFGCTQTITVINHQEFVADLGLFAELGPIMVNETCSLSNAVEAATLGTFYKGCTSGDFPGDSTIELQPDSHHDSVFVPIPSNLRPRGIANRNMITINGTGASIKEVHVAADTAARYGWAVLNNLTIGSVSVGEGEATINDSTVLNNLSVGFDGGIRISNSTVCGVFIEGLVLTNFNREENPCR